LNEHPSLVKKVEKKSLKPVSSVLMEAVDVVASVQNGLESLKAKYIELKETDLSLRTLEMLDGNVQLLNDNMARIIILLEQNLPLEKKVLEKIDSQLG